MTETDTQKKIESPRGNTGKEVSHRGRPPRKGGTGSSGRHSRGNRPRFDRVKPEYDQKIIDTRRVARVVAGGRRFNFKIITVIGNRNGSVGVGTGKAGDTSLAIEKAFRSAKKNLVTIARTKEFSIPHEINAKYNSAHVMVMPAPGRGIVAGSSVRTVLDLAGIRDVGAKVFSSSKNKLNIARATVKALSTFTEKKNK